MSELSRRDLLASGVVLAATGAPSPSAFGQTPAPVTWDLSDLYRSVAAWTAERDAVAKALPELGDFKGKLGVSAASLRSGLQLASDLQLRLARLAVYANLAADADTAIAANQERRQLATQLGASLDQVSAWMRPEILSLGVDKVAAFEEAEPGLARFRFQLDNILRAAPHTLSAESEGVLANAEVVLSAPQDIRTQLADSDIPWPEVQLSTGPAKLDSQGYTAHRQAATRTDRKRVFDTFFGTFKTYESSLGAALSAQVQSDIFQARSRKFPSSLAAAAFGDNIPESVCRTLIAETNAGLPVLHRYFRLRRRMLGLPDLHYYDIYPPVTKIERTFTLEEIRGMTLQAVAPLGPDYVKTLAGATSARWMDPYPRKGKASGAYMNGSAYEVHPYLLLNLNNDYEGLTTFAHEWGHAMHSLLANKAQPFETAQYPTFTAEIASTNNEQLLNHHLQATARTKAEKLFYLNALMELYRATYFRQTMLAEFELQIHDAAEAGTALSGAKLSEMYLTLLRKYHGDAVIIDAAYALEWAYIPHFYYDFYLYQYATSIAASAFFSERTLAGGVKERESYLDVLRAGGSDYPVEILKRAGLDMTTAAPYRALIAKFDKTIDQAEALLA
ncbi:MAG TPA: oligoendopeptidase F [Caulobacteraceae bacterium]|jgi:oligoendopeptidase F